MERESECETERGTSLSTSTSGGQGSARKESTEKPKSWLSKVKDVAVDQWFLIVMGVLICIASQAQVPTAHQQTKRTVVNYLGVAVIFFVNGSTIPTSLLVENLFCWKMHLFVQGQSYLLTSVMAYAVVTATATNESFMDPALLVGLVILGCLPTAIAFNTVMTKKANGNDALTMVQSTVGNILGPFLTTALIKIYTSTPAWYTEFLRDSGGSLGDTYKYVFKRLGLSVFVPLFVAQVLANIFPGPMNKIFVQWKMSRLASLALLMIIWDTYDGAFASHAFQDVPQSNLVFIVFILLAMFLLWFTIAFVLARFWLDREDIIAVAYLVPTKTPAMGAPLTTIMFAGLSAATESRMRLPMVIFQAIQVASCSMLTMPLRKWRARIELRGDGEA